MVWNRILWTKCMCPSSSCWYPIHKWDGGAFRGWLGHKDEAFMSRISAHIKMTSESSPICSTMKGHSKKMAIYEARRWSSPNTKFAGLWILDFQPPELWERNTCCSNYQSWYFCYSFTNGLRHKLIPKVNVQAITNI